MSNFHEVRFPDAIAYGATGGPEYLTDIVILQSGFEQRNQSWDSARARYDVSTGIKNRTQATEVISFFRARKGRAYGFRFKDWSDYRVIGPLIGTGNGTQTAFQLTKTYTSGGENETRPLKKPVSGTVKLYKDGVLQSSGVYEAFVAPLNVDITYSPHWHFHRAEEVLYAHTCQYAEEIPLESAGIGDVLLFGFGTGPAAHAGIIASADTIIHAYAEIGKVAETRLSEKWLARRRFAFRFPRLED